MKRITLLFSLFLIFSWAVNAQPAAIKQANNLYSKGNFEAAAKQYEQVIQNEGVSPELYFNLGNAYYKSTEIGRSILNYERALRLNPSYDDARYNLEIAQLKVVDNFVATPTFFLGRWVGSLIKYFSSNQWLFTAFILFLLVLVALFIFIFGNTRLLRKASFYSAIVLFGFTTTSILFSGIRKNQLVNHHQAIIMTGAVTVKSSPDKSGTDLFQLHEGTKVTLKSALGEWVEIKLGNGSIGWIKQENLEQI